VQSFEESDPFTPHLFLAYRAEGQNFTAVAGYYCQEPVEELDDGPEN